MPDDEDTDPDLVAPDFGDEREAPTRPEGLLLQKCPKCRGEGRLLEMKEWATQHKAIAKLCDLCGGRKAVSARVLADHASTRQGRPPPTRGGS